MIADREEQVRRYFKATDDLMLTDKSMQSIFEISKRFSAVTAIEYIEKNGKVARITYRSYAEKAQNTASAISEKTCSG